MSTNSNLLSPYGLQVRQQPKYARVAVGKEKDRKPIDPPPIVQLTVSHSKDPAKAYLQNPYLILTARLISGKDEDSSPEDNQPAPEPKENDLVGTVVSSLYSLKDTDNSQGGFFVFGDLSVRKEGTYRLEFTLYELKLAERACWMLSRVTSDKFTVYPHKLFPGMAESTFLTRSFSDQGVRLRLRKDSRSMTTRKRNNSVALQADTIRSHYHQDPSPEMSPIRGPQRGYFVESPAYSPYYEERSNKRQRMDSVDSYSPYTSGPRTLPDTTVAMYPSIPMPTQPPMANLPMPTGPPHAPYYSNAI